MLIMDLYRDGLTATDRVRDGLALANDGRRGAANVFSGLGGLHRMGVAARHKTVVGGPLYHSVGDREDAIKQLGIDFAQFQNDLMVALGWKADAPAINETDPRTAWWRINVVPVLTEWQSWQAGELGSWFERFMTSWDSIEKWRTRLVELRDAAKTAGFALQSPNPATLPDTLWDAAGSGLSGIARALWNLLRTIVYVGLVVAGAATLIYVIGRVRGGV